MRHSRLTTLAGLPALIATLIACPAAAADKELLDILLGNGAITEAQYEQLLARDELEPEDVEDIGVTLDSGGFQVRSADGDFAVKIGARLHADFARHTGTDELPVAPTNGTEVRRARIETGGTFHETWRWAAEADFAGNDVSIKDFWLGYRGFDKVNLTFGHQKQPYSLAVEMSSNDIPFMERSIDNGLIIPFVDRAIGVRADASGDRWFAAGGLYGESVRPGGDGDEGWGMAGRYVYTPLLDTDRVLHVAFRGARRYPSDSNPVARIRDETTNFSSLRVVDTGALEGIDHVTLYGPEAAYAQGRLSLTAEYNAATVARLGGDDLDFTSWHVAATWTLGPESRVSAYRLDAGEFKRLTPAQNFRRGQGGGVWELAARFATIDLNDTGFVGGREDALTIGGNWYVNPNVRVLFDWTRIIDTDESDAVRAAIDGVDIFGVRAQYTF